jgi:hypothetical protein
MTNSNEFEFDCPNSFLDLSLFINKRKQSFSLDDIDDKVIINNNGIDDIDEWFFIKHPLHELDTNKIIQTNDNTSSIKSSRALREKGKTLSNQVNKTMENESNKPRLLMTNNSINQDKSIKKAAVPSRVISKSIKYTANTTTSTTKDKSLETQLQHVSLKSNKSSADNSTTMEQKLREFKNSQQKQDKSKDKSLITTENPIKDTKKRTIPIEGSIGIYLFIYYFIYLSIYNYIYLSIQFFI